MVHWFIVGITLPIMVLYMTDMGLDLFEAGLTLSILGNGDHAGTPHRWPERFNLQEVGLFLFPGVLVDQWRLAALRPRSSPLPRRFRYIWNARALYSGSMGAWFVDEFTARNPGADLQRALATANVLVPLGIGAGSLLGGIILMLTSELPGTFDGASDYSVNIMFMICMVALQIVLTHVLVEETSFKASNTSTQGFKDSPSVLSDAISYGVKDRFTFVMVLSSAFLGFGLLSVELLWQPPAQALMEDPSQTWVFGALAAGYFAVSSVGNLHASRGSAFLRRNPLMSLTWIKGLSGLVLLVLAWQSGLLGFAVLYLSLYAVFGLANSLHAAAFNEHIPKERRSTLMSFESLMVQAGGLIGSLIIGWLAQNSGIASAWTIAGIVLAVSSTTYGYLWLRGR
jgi:hypothetical protein